MFVFGTMGECEMFSCDSVCVDCLCVLALLLGFFKSRLEYWVFAVNMWFVLV